MSPVDDGFALYVARPKKGLESQHIMEELYKECIAVGVDAGGAVFLILDESDANEVRKFITIDHLTKLNDIFLHRVGMGEIDGVNLPEDCQGLGLESAETEQGEET